MLSDREAATVCAALLYWQEEMCPHGHSIMLPYFESLGLEQLEPLSAAEILQLISRLKNIVGG